MSNFACLNNLYDFTAPQRGAEVRQLALPIQQPKSVEMHRKDNATATTPVLYKSFMKN